MVAPLLAGTGWVDEKGTGSAISCMHAQRKPLLVAVPVPLSHQPTGRQCPLAMVLLLTVACWLPYFPDTVRPFHDSAYVYECFHYFYNELFFNGEFARWAPDGNYGSQADVFQNGLHPTAYVVGLLGLLLHVKNTLLLVKAFDPAQRGVAGVRALPARRRTLPPAPDAAVDRYGRRAVGLLVAASLHQSRRILSVAPDDVFPRPFLQDEQCVQPRPGRSDRDLLDPNRSTLLCAAKRLGSSHFCLPSRPATPPSDSILVDAKGLVSSRPLDYDGGSRGRLLFHGGDPCEPRAPLPWPGSDDQQGGSRCILELRCAIPWRRRLPGW